MDDAAGEVSTFSFPAVHEVPRQRLSSHSGALTLNPDEFALLQDFLSSPRVDEQPRLRNLSEDDGHWASPSYAPSAGAQFPRTTGALSNVPTIFRPASAVTSQQRSTTRLSQPLATTSRRCASASTHSERAAASPQSYVNSTASPSALMRHVQDLEKQLQASIIKHELNNVNVMKLAEQLCKEYNSVSMKLVGTKEFDSAYLLLQKAEILTEPEGVLAADPALQQRLRAITYNNFGCFYKHRRKPQAALHYLEKAKELESQLPTAENPASTLLNMCATLSGLKRHEQALDYAEQAIQYIATEHNVETLQLENHYCGRFVADSKRITDLTSATASLLAMAYYNKAVELEHLSRYQDAHVAFRCAAGLATQARGKYSKFGKQFQAALDSFQQKLARLRKQQSSRVNTAPVRRRESSSSIAASYENYC